MPTSPVDGTKISVTFAIASSPALAMLSLSVDVQSAGLANYNQRLHSPPLRVSILLFRQPLANYSLSDEYYKISSHTLSFSCHTPAEIPYLQQLFIQKSDHQMCTKITMLA
jgi:hypothetical protein